MIVIEHGLHGLDTDLIKVNPCLIRAIRVQLFSKE